MNSNDSRTTKLYFEDGSIKYEGQILNNLYEGKGKLYFKNTNGILKYEGDFKQGKFNGFGKIYEKDGRLISEGNFINDLPKGFITFRNGDKFIGDLSSNYKRDGFGTLLSFSKNVFYKGTFKDDNIHGKGILYYDSDLKRISIDGNWVVNNLDGYGVTYWPNGNKKWEGYLTEENSKIILNGNCTTYLENGNLNSIAFFTKGKVCGRIRIFKNNFLKYEGEVRQTDDGNGVYHGFGIIYEDNTDKILFEGYFQNGKPDGVGTAYYNDYKFYYGEFKSGHSHGKGTLYYPSGNIKFTGIFCNGTTDGSGMYFEDNINKKLLKFNDAKNFTTTSPVSIKL